MLYVMKCFDAPAGHPAVDFKTSQHLPNVGPCSQCGQAGCHLSLLLVTHWACAACHECVAEGCGCHEARSAGYCHLPPQQMQRHAQMRPVERTERAAQGLSPAEWVLQGLQQAAGLWWVCSASDWNVGRSSGPAWAVRAQTEHRCVAFSLLHQLCMARTQLKLQAGTGRGTRLCKTRSGKPRNPTPFGRSHPAVCSVMLLHCIVQHCRKSMSPICMWLTW